MQACPPGQARCACPEFVVHSLRRPVGRERPDDAVEGADVGVGKGGAAEEVVEVGEHRRPLVLGEEEEDEADDDNGSSGGDEDKGINS